MITLLHSFCSTRYGTTILNNLLGEATETQPELTRLERIKLWADLHPKARQVICSAHLIQDLGLLCGKISCKPLPDSFEDLCKKIDESPTWFLAGSPENSSLVACEIMRSEQGFEFYKSELDAVIMVEPKPLPEAPYLFDLSTHSHSREQSWLLALMGADYLLKSSLFRCVRIGCWA